MRAWRIVLVAAGLLVIGYGALQLSGNTAPGELKLLAIWLIAAVVVHDAILAPVVVAVGWLLRRTVPDRARRYLQAALVVGAFLTVIALPLILREGTQPESKALLLQPYGAHLVLLLGLVAGVSLVAYAVRVARDRKALIDSSTGDGPDQVSADTPPESGPHPQDPTG